MQPVKWRRVHVERTLPQECRIPCEISQNGMRLHRRFAPLLYDVHYLRYKALICCLKTTSMPRPTAISVEPPAAVEAALERLGGNIRVARLRRLLTQAELAERIGVSRFVVAAMEQGKPSTSIAAYLGALWALGLLDDLGSVADPSEDVHGMALERARAPKRARRARTLADDF